MRAALLGLHPAMSPSSESGSLFSSLQIPEQKWARLKPALTGDSEHVRQQGMATVRSPGATVLSLQPAAWEAFLKFMTTLDGSHPRQPRGSFV
jgi:hypothetical protein